MSDWGEFREKLQSWSKVESNGKTYNFSCDISNESRIRVTMSCPVSKKEFNSALSREGYNKLSKKASDNELCSMIIQMLKDNVRPTKRRF